MKNITSEDIEILKSEQSNINRAKQGWTKRIPVSKLQQLVTICQKVHPGMNTSINCAVCILDLLKTCNSIICNYERSIVVEKQEDEPVKPIAKPSNKKTTKSNRKQGSWKLD